MNSDWAGRELTETEQRDRLSLLPALQVWTRYLARMGWFPTLPTARAHGAAVELRERGAGDLVSGVRLAVHPPFALLYAQQVLEQGRAGVSLTGLVAALEFMGARELTRFSPVGEARPSHPRIRAVDGWWNLSREVQRRMQQASYVPVLTPPSGPRRGGVPTVGATVAPRVLRVVGDPELTVRLLRDYTRPHRVTALLLVAVAEHRPLCTRRAGRPATGGSAVAVVTDSVVVGLAGLSGYAVENRDRLGLGETGLSAVRAALDAAGAAHPSLLAPVSGFAALDSGGTVRRARDWWRVRLVDVGHEPVDPVVLAGEVAAWRLGRSMVEVAGVVDGRRRDETAGVAVRMPRGVRAEDVFPDLDGAYVFEADRAAMARSERAARGLLYPDE